MDTDDYDNVRWDDYSGNNNPSSSIYTHGFDEPAFRHDSTPEASTSAPHGKTAMIRTNQDRSTSEPTTTTTDTTTDIPKPMSILVQDPQKYDTNYVTYLVTTTTTVETFSSNNPKPVRRRFQDFTWLYNSLCLEFPACIIPFLPEKYRLKYIKGDRFDKDFIERRRLGLQWFLNRIARHPLLQASQSTRIFLESEDFKNDKQIQSKRIPPNNVSVISAFGDTFLKSYNKIKKPDDRFIMMKESVDKLEENLDRVERLYSRIGRRQQGLEQDYLEFSNSVRGLAMLEPKIDQNLRQFAETMETYAETLADHIKKQDITYLNNIHELLMYCQAAKEQLQERDQKQVDFEELSMYLQRISLERERLLHPGQHFGGGGGGPSISDFMADKMGEIKGNNLTQTRRDRLSRLQYKLEELEKDVSLANDANNTFSSQMIKEYSIFQQTRVIELKQGLADYADCRVALYQKGMDLWTSVLPILTSMNINEPNDCNSLD